MHSLETGIILSIAAFFFFSYMLFSFLREENISKEIISKYEIEKSEYESNGKMNYNPELLNNIINVLKEEDIIKDGDSQ